MKRFSRKKIWFLVLAVLLAVLCSIPYLLQRFYYDSPRAAFYELASALEYKDETKLEKLTNKGARAELYKLAKPYGGISKFGTYLRQSSEVEPVIHMVATVDVFAKVQKRGIMFQFSWESGHWVAGTIFFTD
jgi:hypothetical protein